MKKKRTYLQDHDPTKQMQSTIIQPACAQLGELSKLCFNLRHFSNRISSRLQRSKQC